MARSGKKKSSPSTVAKANDAPAAATPPTRRPRTDPRRFIYGGLDLILVALLSYMIVKIVPNRLPSASVHLWSLPIGVAVMAMGTLQGKPIGRKIALVAGSVVLFSVILMIARIVVSAAFLSGVYGAFGRAAAATALTGIALLVQIVGLLPLVQVKYLMSRAGKRAYAVTA